jgi:hypothetical protein
VPGKYPDKIKTLPLYDGHFDAYKLEAKESNTNQYKESLSGHFFIRIGIIFYLPLTLQEHQSHCTLMILIITVSLPVFSNKSDFHFTQQ